MEGVELLLILAHCTCCVIRTAETVKVQTFISLMQIERLQETENMTNLHHMIHILLELCETFLHSQQTLQPICLRVLEH